jgi:hypothetical protein
MPDATAWERLPSTRYPLYRCRLCRVAVEVRRGEVVEVLARHQCRAFPDDLHPRSTPRVATPAEPVRATYQLAARERWTEELHRPLDQVLGQIDRLAAAGLLPLCGCPDTIQAVLTDLLTPGRWRKQWGEEQAPTSRFG